jgi:ABC-type multidrug transport system fused ATPase/permease subunit
VALSCSHGLSFQRPPPPDNTKFLALSGSAAGLILVVAFACKFVVASPAFSLTDRLLVVWYIGRAQKTKGLRAIQLPSDENAKLMADHIPASLYFSDMSYTLDNHQILSDICGGAQPGQILAIMGASGAGKSTLLDLLARKPKRGSVGGVTLVNGNVVSDDVFRGLVGFVDQEDTLMGTLTVYETVLYSALLRLPREMSLAAKRYRTLETIHELGLDAIKDSRVGESGELEIGVWKELRLTFFQQDEGRFQVVRRGECLSLVNLLPVLRFCSSTNPRAVSVLILALQCMY